MNKTKKTTLLAALTAGMILMNGCNNKPPATNVTAATTAATTTTKETITNENTTTASESNIETMDTPAVVIENPDATAETQSEPNINEPEETENSENTDETNPETPSEISSENPFDEKVIEANVDMGAGLEAINGNMKAVIESGTYTFVMESETVSDDQSMKMCSILSSSPELGKYMNMDTSFIKMKAIFLPDNTVVIIDDENKNYIKTTSEESGFTFSEDGADSMILPVNENVTVADLVEFPGGARAYRFTVAAENNASDVTYDSDRYIYIDENTGYITAMYAVTYGQVTKTTINIQPTAIESMFEIPSDYTEITYAEYQMNLLKAFGLELDDITNNSEE